MKGVDLERGEYTTHNHFAGFESTNSIFTAPTEVETVKMNPHTMFSPSSWTWDGQVVGQQEYTGHGHFETVPIGSTTQEPGEGMSSFREPRGREHKGGTMTPSAVKSKSDGSVQCPYCSKSVSRRKNLSRHINSKHIGRSYDCPIDSCGSRGEKGFRRKDHIIQHLHHVHKDSVGDSKSARERDKVVESRHSIDHYPTSAFSNMPDELSPYSEHSSSVANSDQRYIAILPNQWGHADIMDSVGEQQSSNKIISGNSEDEKMRLRCPFFVQNPERYQDRRACGGPGWRYMVRVKEHLFRSHLPRHRCIRCKSPFESYDKLARHLSSTDRCRPSKSTPSSAQETGYISVEQEKWLRSRMSRAQQSDKERWRALYQVLFGVDPRTVLSSYCPDPPEIEGGGLSYRHEDPRRLTRPHVASESQQMFVQRYHEYLVQRITRQYQQRAPGVCDDIDGQVRLINELFRNALSFYENQQGKNRDENQGDQGKSGGEGEAEGEGELSRLCLPMLPWNEESALDADSDLFSVKWDVWSTTNRFDDGMVYV